MDAATINAKIYAGRAKAALRLGIDMVIYPYAASDTPLGQAGATIKVALNAGDNTYKRPNLYGHPIWFADCDGSKINTGDYLQTPDGSQTYFVGAKQSLLPIVFIECNAMVRVTRAAPPTASAGAVGYSGQCDTPGETVDLMGTTFNGALGTGWPASVLLGKGGQRATGSLPSGSPTSPGWSVLLPASAPAGIGIGDRIMDDQGRILAVAHAESTDMGYRIVATEVHA